MQDSLKCNIPRKKWISKFIFGMQLYIEVLYKLIASIFGCSWLGTPKAPKIRSSSIFAVSPEKRGGMKLAFCLQINTKVFWKLIESFCVFVARHAQSTKNNKFAISLQYLKENMKDEIYFLHVDKHQSFLQIDAMAFDGDGQVFPKFTK